MNPGPADAGPPTVAAPIRLGRAAGGAGPTGRGPGHPRGWDGAAEGRASRLHRSVREATEGRRPWLPQDEWDAKQFERRLRWVIEEGEHRQAELKRRRARQLRTRGKR